MKSLLTLLALCLLITLCFANPLSTRITSYRTLNVVADIATTDDDDLTTTGYAPAAKSGEVDLMGGHQAGGTGSYANAVVMIVKADDASADETVTQKLYGRVDGGPPQLIASIVWTLGTALADGSTADYLWADTAVVADYHITEIVVSDGDGNNRVASVALDATGYRYLYSIFTATSSATATTTTCLYRVY